MEKLEKVERLHEKAGVSFEDAKAALEACDWDMLEAMVYLEKQGKVHKSGNTYSTKEEPEMNGTKEERNVGSTLERFFVWCEGLMQKSIRHMFVVERRGEQVLQVPILVFIILLIAAFWVTVPLLIIGLFFEMSYSFRGTETDYKSVNRVIGKATEVADEIKDEIRRETQKSRDEGN